MTVAGDREKVATLITLRGKVPKKVSIYDESAYVTSACATVNLGN